MLQENKPPGQTRINSEDSTRRHRGLAGRSSVSASLGGSASRNTRAAVVLLAAVAIAPVLAADRKEGAAGEPATRPVSPGPFDLAILLVGDPAVQEELKCRADQKRAIRGLLDEIDRPVFFYRDAPAEQHRARLEPLVTRVSAGLRAILTPAQRQRLQQLMIQQRGPDALRWAEVRAVLGLSAGQASRVIEELDRTRAELAALASEGRSATRPPDLNRAQYEIRKREQDRILAVLTDDQKQKWTNLRGKRFDFSVLQPLPARAPEFADADAWVNSGPLSLAGLRGRVVVVHFWTFGCSNCIHNYWAYRDWQTDFGPRGVTLIGIHTPETRGEHDLERLKAKARENQLTYPILVDNQKHNWEAWNNSVWPSVYLVDRGGYVRFWWYGELRWGGIDGEKLMRDRIEQLLAEQGDPPAASAPAAP